MANVEFLNIRKTLEERFGHVIEELGEVLQAAGKIVTWGFAGFNPTLPEAERETNIDMLLRELADAKLAISRFEDKVREEYGRAKVPLGPVMRDNS